MTTLQFGYCKVVVFIEACFLTVILRCKNNPLTEKRVVTIFLLRH